MKGGTLAVIALGAAFLFMRGGAAAPTGGSVSRAELDKSYQAAGATALAAWQQKPDVMVAQANLAKAEELVRSGTLDVNQTVALAQAIGTTQATIGEAAITAYQAGAREAQVAFATSFLGATLDSEGHLHY